MKTFLQQLQAGKVTLRHLLAAARTADDLEVFESRETTTEVLRQLCGHIERLIGESTSKTDLAAAYADLERRFEVWREGEQQRIREHAKVLQQVDAVHDLLHDVRRLIWDAYESMEDTNERVQEGYSVLEQAEVVIQAADAATQLMTQVDDLSDRVKEVERFIGRLRGAAEDEDDDE